MKDILYSRPLKLNFFATLLLTIIALSSRAQLNPSQNMYFRNRYMLNPAFAGINKGLNLNLGYRQQWSNFPGMPKTTLLTADYKATEKVGLGVNLNDQQSGLLRSTRAVGTYAYHLPISDNNEHLSFGVSLGFNDSRINYSKVNGDISDEQVALYNQLKPYVDGDFGAAYTNEKLMVSASLPNLKSTFFRTSDSRFDADMLIGVAAVSYQFDLSTDAGAFTLSPIAVYRFVKGYKDIFDAGFNFTMNDYGLYMQAIYHTNQNLSIGAGIDMKTYAVNLGYNLETGLIGNYTQGAFELGLSFRLFGKQN